METNAIGKSNQSLWALRVDEARLSDGHITYSRPAKELAAEIQSLAVHGSMDTAAGRGEADISVPALHVKRLGIDQTIHDLSLRGTYGMDSARPWQIAVQTPSSHLSARGKVRLGWIGSGAGRHGTSRS